MTPDVSFVLLHVHAHMCTCSHPQAKVHHNMCAHTQAHHTQRHMTQKEK